MPQAVVATTVLSTLRDRSESHCPEYIHLLGVIHLITLARQMLNQL